MVDSRLSVMMVGEGGGGEGSAGFPSISGGGVVGVRVVVEVQAPSKRDNISTEVSSIRGL